MGLLDKTIDKVTGTNTIRLPYDKLAEMVKKEFIDGATPDMIRKIAKAVKGGKAVVSATGGYELSVSIPNNFISILALVAPRRDVYIDEKNTNNLYMLDRDKNYGKFRKLILKYLG